MKISIITVTYNAAPFIRSCIDSVLSQDHPDVEYIVVDGSSTDGTQEIVRSYGDQIGKFVSEPDSGLYDAMNKGISMATGDIIGILNADDFYPGNGILTRVAKEFTEKKTDTVFGDLVYVRENDLDKVVRYFPGKGFEIGQLSRGMMPPHPTFFVRKRIYEKFGLFDTSYRICSDFDLMVRFFHTGGVNFSYIPEVLVKMRMGGYSTQGFRSNYTINREMLRACKKHGIPTNLARIYSKYFTKIFQLFHKPPTKTPTPKTLNPDIH
jgi:glycosyltransferase involved in cell wall biosynthesis